MIDMNAVNETKPARARPPRKTVAQSPRNGVSSVAKSKDAGKVKVSLYLDVETHQKLNVSAVLRRSDQSDIANEILGNALSSITFYDRSTRRSDESLPVTEIGGEAAA